MSSHEQPESKTTPPDHDEVQQAELYAASAAEGAIAHRKDPTNSEDLHQLTVSTGKVSLDDIQKTQPTETPSTEQTPSSPRGQPDRALSKEELVEEALNCPCIASMRDGSCGDQFITAYKCFLESETDPKGMDCMAEFKSMQGCIAEHPEEYNLDDDDDADPFAAQRETRNSDGPSSSLSPDSDKTNPNPVASSTPASS